MARTSSPCFPHLAQNPPRGQRLGFLPLPALAAYLRMRGPTLTCRPGHEEGDVGWVGVAGPESRVNPNLALFSPEPRFDSATPYQPSPAPNGLPRWTPMPPDLWRLCSKMQRHGSRSAQIFANSVGGTGTFFGLPSGLTSREPPSSRPSHLQTYVLSVSSPPEGSRCRGAARALSHT